MDNIQWKVWSQLGGLLKSPVDESKGFVSSFLVLIMDQLFGTLNTGLMWAKLYQSSNTRIKVPIRLSWYYQLLHIDFQRANYASAEPIQRMCMKFDFLIL